jgi:DNA anti-recombination protein RmuC
MQVALQMSMQAEQTQDSKEQVNELLGNLPEVNPNDPAIQSALRNLKKGRQGWGR